MYSSCYGDELPWILGSIGHGTGYCDLALGPSHVADYGGYQTSLQAQISNGGWQIMFVQPCHNPHDRVHLQALLSSP
jgi:hypothetical protein